MEIFLSLLLVEEQPLVIFKKLLTVIALQTCQFQLFKGFAG
jgi:hypothetical protein